MTLSTEAMVNLLWQRAAIEERMLSFGRALDRGDWELYRSGLTDRIRVDFERLTGFPEVEVDADDWVRFAELALSPVRRHHQYSNFSIIVDGDRATATIYMVARHHKATDRGSSENIQYGWYDMQFVLQAGDWKIARLGHDFAWVSGNDALLDFSEPALAAQTALIFCAANRVSRSGPVVAP